ncbi:Diphthamide biosynthesis protein 2 [Tulasnella sp. 332]|nr:Diphthamide biosynthesis protein 2 [Tulasnella sp. 332]
MESPLGIALSSSGEDAIAREIMVSSAHLDNDTPIGTAYETEWTASQIISGSYHRVALQFPDELLHVSVPIYRDLRARLPVTVELYVLADTTYGSCCVDEVAAQHVDSDAVVHYGHTCLSPTSRLPVIYVFGQRPVDGDLCAEALLKGSGLETKPTGPVLLLCDLTGIQYENLETIASKLKTRLPLATTLVVPRIQRVARPQATSFSLDASPSERQPEEEKPPLKDEGSHDHRYTLPPGIEIGDCTILYVGGEGLALSNLLMTHSANDVWSFDPGTGTVKLESGRTNKMLMRRYAMVQKARDADVFGILIGTLGVAQYLPMIKRIREQLTRAQKKVYTVSVGKLNPSKLANFMEIECFVLVACPENSVIDSKDFLRPIVTPFELEIVLQSEPNWTGRYLLDFERVLTESKDGNGVKKIEGSDEEDSDRPTFSLMTGTYRYAKKYGKPTGDEPHVDITALSLRSKDDTVARFMDSAAGEYLQGRTFQGLERRLGQDAPSTLEQGRSGIARGYGEDNSCNERNSDTRHVNQ